MPEERDYRLEMDKALEFRKYEIDNFWKRGWFFGALVIFLLSANFKIHDMYSSTPLIQQPYSVIVSFLAVVTAIAQAFINRGSKYWQERWEYIAKNRELANKSNITNTRADDYHKISACILDKEEFCFARAKRISVSKLTFIVWDILAFTCLVNWLNEGFLFFGISVSLEIAVIIYHAIAVIYILSFIVWGKIGSRLNVEEKNSRRNSKSEKKACIKRLKNEYIGEDKV